MYYVGINLGGTGIKAGVTDREGNIICKDSIPTGADRPYQEITRDMAMLALKVMKDAGLDKSQVKSIGIGSPGTPNNEKGILVYANNFKNFVNVPLRQEIQKYINVDVEIDNDANCAALAEHVAGAAKGTENSVTITLGTGVGTGVVIHNRLYSGFNYSAAEMGHMVIIAGGEQCTCGRKGCWEAYASATGLIAMTARAAGENPNSVINRLTGGDISKIDAKTAFDAAREGDETGRKLVDRYIEYVAIGIANVINIFAPELVVIGGGISKEGENLLAPLREKVSREVYFKEEPKTRIVRAVLGNDAGIVGAAMLGALSK